MSVDFGRATVVLRRRRASLRIHRRSLLVIVVLAAVLIALTAVSLAVGSITLGLDEVVATLLGGGDRRSHLVVVEWRLPRVLFAIGCGVALAISGAIFQSITRNPLGSPDVIGFDAGSYSGALVVMLAIGSGSYAAIAAGALGGGLVTAAVVYLLSYRRGVQGFRLIIVGIGVGAMLTSLNSYLLITVDVKQAILATAWGAGSLNALGFDQLLPFGLGLLVLIPLVMLVAPSLSQNELGDDASSALGTRVERTRLLSTIVAVALTALVTAAAGPISFIALVAPQIAVRLTRSSGLGLTAAAGVGAVLLVAADFAAQRITVPVGLVTVSLGGCYLIYLLTREYRRS